MLRLSVKVVELLIWLCTAKSYNFGQAKVSSLFALELDKGLMYQGHRPQLNFNFCNKYCFKLCYVVKFM